MILETLSCNNCGAPLQVPETANFVTCNHCETQLAIHRSATAAWTEQLDELGRQTDQLAVQVARLTAENKRASLDRDWDRAKQQYMIADKHGRRRVPNSTMSIVGAVVTAGFGIFFTVFAGAMSGPFALFGIVFVVFAIGIGLYGHSKAKEYQAAHRRYRRKRASITPESVMGGQTPERFLSDLDDVPMPREVLERLEESEDHVSQNANS